MGSAFQFHMCGAWKSALHTYKNKTEQTEGSALLGWSRWEDTGQNTALKTGETDRRI